MPKRLVRKPGVFARLEDLYTRMETAYNATAAAAGLTCTGCDDNCCRTHFRHHTRIEWAYLWKGMLSLSPERREAYLERAKDVVAQCDAALAAGVVPRVMCPLNDEGRCGLYKYRLMICRMHGTRNILRLPDGRTQVFRGCHRFDNCTAQFADADRPSLDRTPLYTELAKLEMEHLGPTAARQQRVDLTLAEMLVYGPPKP